MNDAVRKKEPDEKKRSVISTPVSTVLGFLILAIVMIAVPVFFLTSEYRRTSQTTDEPEKKYVSRSELKAEYFLKGTDVSLEQAIEKSEELRETSIFPQDQILETLGWSVSWYGSWDEAIEKTEFALDVAAFSEKNLEETRVLIGNASRGDIEALQILGEISGVPVK